LGSPHYSYINDDITAINITNGDAVTKTEDDPDFHSMSDSLVVGGNNCTLTLDNASSLTLGDWLHTGVGAGAETTVNVHGGSAFSSVISLAGYGGTCAVDIDAGSSFTTSSSSWLGWNGGTGYMTVDGGTYSSGGIFRLGGYNADTTTGGTAEITVQNGGLVEVVSDFYLGYELDSQATVTVDASTINVATDNSSRSGVGFWGEGEMTLKNNSSFTTGGIFYIARQAAGTMRVQSGSSVTTGNMLVIGEAASAIGILNIDGGIGATKSSLVSNTSIIAGHAGSATVTVTNGGRFEAADILTLGVTEGGSGVLNLESGSLARAGGDAYIGSAYIGDSVTPATGTANLTDSTLEVGGNLWVGYKGAAVGELNVHGSSVVDVSGNLETFADPGAALTGAATADIHIYDGDVDIDGWAALGRATTGGTTTVFTLDAGTIDIGLAPVSIGDLILGWCDTDADVDLNLNGGVMTVHGALCLGRTTDETGAAITNTGSGSGQIRITVDGGVLQVEDYLDAGTITDHLLTMTDGQFRVNASAVSTNDMADLISAGDIVCSGSYSIYTEGFYTVLEATGTRIPGDTNNDGKVNETDAQVLATNWGSSVTEGYLEGDFNDDDMVSVLDAAILAANWGDHTSGESTGAVPEPGAIVLLLSAALGLLVRRGRRQVSHPYSLTPA
jgi:hypothetical protein